MTTMLAVLGYTPITLIFLLTLWRHGELSWGSGLQWALLYVAAVLLPLVWARRAHAMAATTAATQRQARYVSYYIVVPPALTLLVALAIIARG